MIRVHTTVFIVFPTVHTNTPQIRCEGIAGRSSSLSFSKDGRDILKFSFHSSGTTVCETKLSHHALVRPVRIQNLLALANHVFEPNEVLEKVLLLWGTNKRLKSARFNSKQAIKNRSIFFSAMFVLIFYFGARACYSTTWHRWRHRFHFYQDPTVHTSTKDVRIRFYPLSRAFPNLYGFGGSDPRVSVDGRPKRIKKYTDSNESALVWTGPEWAEKKVKTVPHVFCDRAEMNVQR